MGAPQTSRHNPCAPGTCSGLPAAKAIKGPSRAPAGRIRKPGCRSPLPACARLQGASRAQRWPAGLLRRALPSRPARKSKRNRALLLFKRRAAPRRPWGQTRAGRRIPGLAAGAGAAAAPARTSGCSPRTRWQKCAATWSLPRGRSRPRPSGSACWTGAGWPTRSATIPGSSGSCWRACSATPHCR